MNNFSKIQKEGVPQVRDKQGKQGEKSLSGFLLGHFEKF